MKIDPTSWEAHCWRRKVGRLAEVVINLFELLKEMVIGTAASKFKMNVIRLELTLMSMMVTMMGSLKMPVKMMTCRRGRGM